MEIDTHLRFSDHIDDIVGGANARLNVQNKAIRIGLRLPSYLSIKLIHDAACLLKIEDRFQTLNKSLLNTMIANNEYIKDLAQNRQSDTFITNTLSPIEIIMK